MEKLQMCRICLVENVPMYVVVNRNLRILYEKLTDIPFLTEDRRPILACFFCCTKLKQCWRLLRKCLEAEEQFTPMMNVDYKSNFLMNQDSLEFCSGFIKSPIEHLSIVDECQTESIAIKEELPAVCEGLDDIIEPKEVHQSDELEPENVDNSCLDVADIPPQHSESDLEDDVPLIEFKTEVVEEEVSKKKRTATETKRSNLAKKPKLDARRTKPEDAITAEQQKKENSDSKVIRPTLKRTSKPGTYCKEPYKCDQRSLNQTSRLTNHIGIATGEKSYKCDVCQRSFSRKNYLTKHIRTHTGERPFKCDKHTGEKLYKCHVCEHSFSEKRILKRHIRIHTGEKPYKCDVCQRGFYQNRDLTIHIRVHTGDKPYKCDICQRSYTKQGALTNHIRVHTGDKLYKCDICQRSFTNQSTLTNHIRKHTGEKLYKCHVCEHSFSEKGILKRHIRIHTGEKPYKCDVCQRGFNQNSDLTIHIRVHTGDKPYKCDICQRSFTQQSNLTKHIRKHTGEKPYVSCM